MVLIVVPWTRKLHLHCNIACSSDYYWIWNRNDHRFLHIPIFFIFFLVNSVEVCHFEFCLLRASPAFTDVGRAHRKQRLPVFLPLSGLVSRHRRCAVTLRRWEVSIIQIKIYSYKTITYSRTVWYHCLKSRSFVIPSPRHTGPTACSLHAT